MVESLTSGLSGKNLRQVVHTRMLLSPRTVGRLADYYVTSVGTIGPFLFIRGGTI